MAMVMEIFLTHPQIASWQYPHPAVFKILTVPLFAGFMYSAVGSFFARSLRLYHVSFAALAPFLRHADIGGVVLYQLYVQIFLFPIFVIFCLRGA